MDTDKILHKKFPTIYLICLVLISFTIQTFGQDTIGVYYHIDKIKNGPSFGTKLIFMSDSTFQYTFKGDLFNDFAEGTFSQIDNLIRLKYTTPDYSKIVTTTDKIINTQPQTTVKVNEESRFPNPVAHLWPTEIIMKKNKLIIIKTKEHTESRNKVKFEKMTDKQ